MILLGASRTSYCVNGEVERRDNHLVAADHRGVGRATRDAPKDRVVELRVHSALSTFDHCRNRAYFQRNTVQRGSEHHHFPAVAQRVWNDLAKVPDVDAHTLHGPPRSCLMGDLGDRRADRKFVHDATLEGLLGYRRLDNGAAGL